MHTLFNSHWDRYFSDAEKLYTSALITGLFNDKVNKLEDGSWKIELAVPGYAKEDVNVSAKNKLLEVVLKQEGGKESKLHYRLTSDIDTSKIKATCKHGLLTVTLPLRETERSVTVSVE